MRFKVEDGAVWIGAEIDKQDLDKIISVEKEAISYFISRIRNNTISLRDILNIPIILLLRNNILEKNNKSARSREALSDKQGCDCNGNGHPRLRRRVRTSELIRSKISQNGKRVSKPNGATQQEESVKVSTTNGRIIRLWENLGLRKSNPNTKAFKSAIKLLNKARRGQLFLGTEFEKDNQIFVEQDFVESIRNFSLAALDHDYEPRVKDFLKSTDLASFLFNEWASVDKSRFLKYLKAKPVLANKEARPITDHHPAITKQLMAFYAKAVGGKTNFNFSQAEKNAFARGADRVVTFYEDNKSALADWVREEGPSKIAEVLCESFKEDVERNHNEDWSKVSVGWLCSSFAVYRKLPAYLKKQNMLDGEKEFSIYDN